MFKLVFSWIGIFSCEAQLNTCTCAVSIRPSFRLKTEFLIVWSAYDSL